MNSWIRRTLGIGMLVVVCAYAVVALRGPRGMSALFEKRREIKQLQDDNATLKREVEMKKERIERLKHNTAEQELEIRKRLKLLRPGETEFILPEAPKQESASPAQ